MTLKSDAIYTPNLSTRCVRPVFVARVPAGFPSSADDYIEGKLDLNKPAESYDAGSFACQPARHSTGFCRVGKSISF